MTRRGGELGPLGWLRFMMVRFWYFADTNTAAELVRS
jgi:hypothetical protein